MTNLFQRYKSLISESATFHQDNPGGEWEKRKQEYAEEDMTDHAGKDGNLAKGFSGSVTGYFSKPLELPVEHLKNLPGIYSEHKFREDASGQKAKNLESDIGTPTNFDTKSHPIFITVNHRGEPYVSEGNHRLGYAVRHGIKKIHAEVRYFNGGENVKNNFHPDKLLELHDIK